MIVFHAILQNGESEQDAIDYANGTVWCEVETSDQNIKYQRYIDTVNGIDIYYDYGADYYFFSPVDDD